MANCFGEIVDNYKLDTIARYVGKPKTQEDRAREAMILMNEGGKSTNAHDYVEGLKSEYGSGNTTLCTIYNATGDTLHYVTSHDWWGYVGRTPYPHEIGNGQWASFLHVSSDGGSAGAVVYRGKDKDYKWTDFLVAWDTPSSPFNPNKAYCGMNVVDHFKTRVSSIYYDHFIKGGEHYWLDTNAGSSKMEATIAKGTSPRFTATISTPFGP